MKNNIQAEHIEIGYGTIISPTASIRGLHGKASKIIIGDNCYIGDDVQIICDDFSLGDYSKIHHHVNIHGYKPCKLGHNAWIGQYTIIDSIGGTTIGNNCGIGAHSQLWSHIKYGDTLEGCQFFSEKPLTVEDDVWFVGHCIVSPIHAAAKSMALAGSVIVNDMESNCVYGGAPAKNLTEKIGKPFVEISLSEKIKRMKNYLHEWNPTSKNIKIVAQESEIDPGDTATYFVVADRKYTKKRTDEEISFMRYLLPEKAKFTPY